MLLTLAIVSVGSRVNPGTAPLSQGDVDTTIKNAMASATPKPGIGIQAYDKVKDSIVLVKSRMPGETDLQPRGAGVIFDGSGRVLTSLHLVLGAQQIRVVFWNGVEGSARIADPQPEFDVAVLEVSLLDSGMPLKPAVLATAGKLKIGDEAIVVGSPLGIRSSLTMGVVSALGTHFFVPGQSREIGGLIQINAPLSAGSAGGPLIHRNGEVMGVVAGVGYSAGSFVADVGFVVPIDSAASAAGNNPF